MPPQSESCPVGDSAGEYRSIRRGNFSAWGYVVIAFLLESLLVGGAVEGTLSAMGKQTSDLLFIVAGILGALPVFWNRWRCIEAFSSRFCAGVVNLSLFYMPFVAFGYANYRGFLKLLGR